MLRKLCILMNMILMIIMVCLMVSLTTGVALEYKIYLQ